MGDIEGMVRHALEARKPGEALLHIARQIDDLWARIEGSEAGADWSVPLAATTESGTLLGVVAPAPNQAAFDQAAADAEYARKLKELGPEPRDAESLESWQARRRLLEDERRPATPDIGIAKTQFETVGLGRDNFEVRIPVASAEVQQARRELALAIGLDQERWWTRPELALPTGAAVEYYMKGGPVWLHAYDRDFVMSLGQNNGDVLRAMVADVQAYSPDDAHDLARDVLKDADPTGSRQVTMEHQARENDLVMPSD